MRKDTPPHSNCGDDDVELDLEARMEFNAMLAEEGILIDDGEEDYEDPDSDEDELEEIELDELERRLNAMPRERAENQNNESDDDGIGMRATPEDKALLTFKGHTSPVFSCHIHPEYDIAVTGGQDDVAYLWDINDGHILETIKEHTDTVTEAKFSHDGNYLFTADMAGNICVFRLQTPTPTGTDAATSSSGSSSSSSGKAERPQISINKIWTNSIGDMSWCFWHDRSNVLFASSAETGEIYMWRIPSGECKVFVGPGSCCAAGELTDDSKKLFASYKDGSLRLWDLRTNNAPLCIEDQHSNELVPSVACDKNGPLYASGDVDGKILFCTQNGPVQTVQTEGLVECLAFSPSVDLKLLASATLDGVTTIWDCTHYTKRLNCIQPDNAQDGVCSMKWLNAFALAIGTVEGDILIYDARSGNLLHKLTGHRAHIYELYYSRRTNLLLSVSEDCKAKLFSLPELDI